MILCAIIVWLSLYLEQKLFELVGLLDKIILLAGLFHTQGIFMCLVHLNCKIEIEVRRTLCD